MFILFIVFIDRTVHILRSENIFTEGDDDQVLDRVLWAAGEKTGKGAKVCVALMISV